MIEVASFLDEGRQRSLVRCGRFLEAYGLQDDEFAITATKATPPDVRFSAVYRSYAEAGELNAAVDLLVGRRRVRAKVDLLNAQLILGLIASDPDFARLILIDLPEDVSDAMRAVSLDPAHHLKPHVTGWAEGNWIAREAGGFLAFYVDDYGPPVVPLVLADHGPDAAFLLAAITRAQDLNIVSKMIAIDEV